MPQLVKGGKHVFGWSRVGSGGEIQIPPEALSEYGFQEGETLVLVPGSRTSGGFGLGSWESVQGSPLGGALSAGVTDGDPGLALGKAFEHGGKTYAWLALSNGGVAIPPETLARYGARVGDPLLVIRGSGLALGFAVRGPIVDEARSHPELGEF
jgi:hypothetical protein